MKKKRKMIELDELIAHLIKISFQNRHKMTRVKDLNQLKSRVYYLDFQFLRANFPMNKTLIS